jgi:hypothetical protein
MGGRGYVAASVGPTGHIVDQEGGDVTAEALYAAFKEQVTASAEGGADDQPSIGIILCKSRNKVLVEYALRDTSKPIGVAEYRLTEVLPENLKGTLPTIEELEAGRERSAKSARAEEGNSCQRRGPRA